MIDPSNQRSIQRYKYNLRNVLILASLVCLSCHVQQKEKTPPNILIIFTDDQGYGDLSCYGASEYQTPNIDRLASEGIRFTNFYVPATVCTPSRAALLTGSYPKRVGLHEAVLFPFSDTGLSPDEFTMAEMLKNVGYQTACIGKWHLGHHKKFMPNQQGFDYFFGVPYSNDMDSHFYEDRNFQSPPLPLYENENLLESGPDQRYLTQRYTDSAINFIKQHGDSQFFIYLAHNMPHIPLYVSEPFEQKTPYGLYGDVISELDWNVGRLVQALKDGGLFENTIIVFTSDNGPYQAINAGSAKPLRGWKAQTWEGGQRVPGIITWPDQIPSGVVSNEVVTTMDLLPTFAAITASELPKSRTIDGRNIQEFLLEPNNNILDSDPFFYYGRAGILEAVRLGKWKLHLSKTLGNSATSGQFSIALYNLEKDIGEKDNLVEQYPEVTNQLKLLISSFDNRLNQEARPVGIL